MNKNNLKIKKDLPVQKQRIYINLIQKSMWIDINLRIPYFNLVIKDHVQYSYPASPKLESRNGP